MTYICLLIEFLDELVYGVSEAAWPFIRADLDLDYVQIGLALSLLAFVGLFNSGWYAILQARLYDSMPRGLSSTAIAVGSVTGFFGKLLPFGIGLAAQAFGLGAAIWFLLAGPIALWIGLPRDLSRDWQGRGTV